MRFEHLRGHGFPHELVGVWTATHGDALLPLQERAVVTTGLLRGGNVVVSAPTSSGKTLVAEMAAMHHVTAGRKAVFLVPTKALAEEQFASLRATYSPLRVRAVISTRERTRFDRDILDGRFDIAVMVYEKFKALLTVAPGMAARIGVVVVDELQILGERERGAVADLLLAKLLSGGHSVQIVALSAVLGDGGRLGTWIGGDFLQWRERPVELREGVLRLPEGVFAYREQNSGAEGGEQILAPDTCAGGEEQFHMPAIQLLAGTLADRGEQVLVFVPTRHLCRQWAWQFSRDRDFAPPAGLRDERDALLARLDQHEESHSREILAQCFARGIGIHNADVPADLRRMVEDAFRSGVLRVLVATSTLAQGVNLRCRNVVSVPVMVGEDGAGGPPGFVPLSRQRFRNQGGRAGRLSGGDDFGRSILVAGDAAEAGHLEREYVRGGLEDLGEPIRAADLDKLVLDLVAAGMGAGVGAPDGVLMRTYTAHVSWAARPEHLRAAVESALGRLAEAGLATMHAGDAPASTALGEAAAAFGIEVSTAVFFARWLRERGAPDAGFGDVTPFEVLALCAFSADGAMFPLPLTAAEKRDHHFARELASRGDIRAGELPAPLCDLLTVYGGLGEAAQTALKKAFLAEYWISAAPTADVEEGYRTFAGTVANLAAHFSWLAQALAACASALGMDRAGVDAIAQIAARLPDGVLPQGLPLARLEIPGLTRAFIADMVRAGYERPADIASAPPEEIARVLPPHLAERVASAARDRERRRAEADEPGIWGWFRHTRGGSTTAAATPDAMPASDAAGPPDLWLSLRSPGQVRFHGVTVMLRPKAFRLLALLACNPGRVVAYTEIDERLWPDEKVEQQQTLAHRRAIVRALDAAHNAKAGGLIRVVKGQGLMLDMPPDRVDVEDAG